MAKNRIVNTRFWVDDYVSNLDPVEKLLFLYFLTNPSTDISGIYELPVKNIALDTGLDKEMVLRIIKRFTKDRRVFYINGWVGVKNFIKHQTLNPKVEAGIKAGILKAPSELVRKLELDLDSLSIDYDSLSDTNFNSNGNSNPNLNLKSLQELVEPLKSEYEQNLVTEFLEHWTEKNPGGAKERWQMEKIFDPSKRLKTWARNAEKWGQKNQPKKIISI